MDPLHVVIKMFRGWPQQGMTLHFITVLKEFTSVEVRLFICWHREKEEI